MIEIKMRDVQVNQTYYIQRGCGNRCSNRRYLYQKADPYYGAKFLPKIKAVCVKICPDGYAYFRCYAGLNSSELGDNTYNVFRLSNRHVKCYLPTRDALLEKRERDTINKVLQHITGDPSFKYYL